MGAGKRKQAATVARLEAEAEKRKYLKVKRRRAARKLSQRKPYPAALILAAAMSSIK